jgi:hypothetical protein
MKNLLKPFLTLLVAGIVAFESTNLSFWLMTQPNSFLFYLGLFILSTTFFFVGWGVGEFGKRLYLKFKNKSEDLK